MPHDAGQAAAAAFVVEERADEEEPADELADELPEAEEAEEDEESDEEAAVVAEEPFVSFFGAEPFVSGSLPDDSAALPRPLSRESVR